MATPKKLTPRQAAAVRANLLARKISDKEARVASSTMNKRPGSAPAFVSNQRPLLSKSEREAEGRQSKINADKEKAMQKQRRFAKGEGKLPIKERVGTKAEYKKLGEEIATRKKLIAYAKQARINQAERAKNPKPTPAKPTPVKETTPVAEKKKTTPAKTTAKKTAATSAKKAAATPKAKTPKAPVTKKAAATPKAKTPKASTAAIKERTLPATEPKKTKTKKAKTPKVTKTPELQTLKQAEASAPKPKGAQAAKLQTLAEAKAKAPTPKMGPEAPAKTEAPKVEAKAAEVAKKTPKTSVGKTLSNASKTKLGKQVTGTAKKIAGKKVVKVAGKLAKVGIAIGAGREVAQVVSGQAEKDFRRIQALENRIAVAKGQKKKYTKVGSNRNLGESLKVDFSNAASILTGGIVGKGRKARLEEVRALAKKAEAKKPVLKKSTTKPNAKPAVITTPGGQKVGGSTPAKAPIGNKYTVKKGDTLSAIASRSGVSLSELRAANPKFTTQAKYKGGNMIFSGTTVAIPKKKGK